LCQGPDGPALRIWVQMPSLSKIRVFQGEGDLENDAEPAGNSPEWARYRAFSRSLPMALMRAREDVMAGFRPNLRAHKITEQQWRAIKALAKNGEMRAGQLAKSSLISMPSLTRILRDLEKRKLIMRRPEPNDQRAALISLTPDGEAMVVSVGRGAEPRYDHIARAFGPERLELLHQLLDELSGVLKS